MALPPEPTVSACEEAREHERSLVLSAELVDQDTETSEAVSEV